MINFDDIKKNYPIVSIAKRLNINVLNNNTCRCIFHSPDNKPSMSFNLKTNRYKCFSCGADGSNIDLVMKVLNYDIKEACRYITGINYEYKIKNTYYLKKENTKNKTYIERNNKDYHHIYKFIIESEHTYYGDYLKKRGINIAMLDDIQCKIIKNSYLLEKDLVNKFTIEELKEAGLYSKNNKFLFKDNYLLIPYFNKENRIHTIKARSIIDKIFINCNSREIILYGINRLHNNSTLIIDGKKTTIEYKTIETVYICESEIDALSFLETGRIALATAGTSWNDNYTKELLKINNIVLATDNDIAGIKLRNNIINSFSKYHKQVKVLNTKAYQNCKDINELLVKETL